LLSGQEKVTKEKATPTSTPDGLLFVRCPAVLAANRPANNSHIPVLKQFAYSRLPAALLGVSARDPFKAKARASCAQKRIARRQKNQRDHFFVGADPAATDVAGYRGRAQVRSYGIRVERGGPRRDSFLWRAGCAFNGAP